jgi:hypothetical protein
MRMSQDHLGGTEVGIGNEKKSPFADQTDSSGVRPMIFDLGLGMTAKGLPLFRL